MYPGRWVRQPVTLSLRFIQVFDLQGKFRPWRRGGTFACVLVATFAAVYACGSARARLDYRMRELFPYVESNGGSTIAYGKRQRDGRRFQQRWLSQQSIRFLTTACASDNRCDGHRGELTYWRKFDVLSSTAT